jgi:DNA polymerase-3 subunit epsilon
MRTLQEIIKEQRLCPGVAGIESGKDACFSSRLQQRNGVCAGREKPELHYCA